MALCTAVACNEAAARAVLQLGALGPLIALFDTPFSTDPTITEGAIIGQTADAALTIILMGLHTLVTAAGDGGSSFARVVLTDPGGFVRALTAAACQEGFTQCWTAMSLLCALGSETSADQLRLLAARNPHLVADAAKVLCHLLGAAVAADFRAAQLCCPVYGSCPHILHTFEVIAIPESDDAGATLASAAWVPEVVAALHAAVAEPPTAASCADTAPAQQRGEEAGGRAECLARKEMRRAAAELLHRLQAARDIAAKQQQQHQQPQQEQQQQQQQQEQQQQQLQHREARQQRPLTQPQAGVPAAPPAAGAAAASERCAECGTGGRLRLCRGCRAVRYCGEECARRAWKGGHRAECLAAQAAGQQAGQQPSGQQLQPQ
jgi:hypothetical protein